MEYTKGDWKVDIGDSTVYADDGKGRFPTICSLQAKPDRAERIANAHLIAAAPDLYEAAKELMESVNGGVRFPLQSTVDKMNQALSLAEEK